MKKELNLPTNKNFGLVFSLVFLIISLWPLISQNEIRYWALILSVIFLTLGLLNSTILLPLNKMWIRFGIFLGNIISPIMMGIIYFFVVTPTGFALRALKKDVLRIKKNNKETYWVKKEDPKSNMENQF
jgi:large-conductance mechanosensitive channel